jgi:hypothetical protein
MANTQPQTSGAGTPLGGVATYLSNNIGDQSAYMSATSGYQSGALYAWNQQQSFATSQGAAALPTDSNSVYQSYQGSSLHSCLYFRLTLCFTDCCHPLYVTPPSGLIAT